MKVAANVAMVFLLLFGFTAFGFFQNAFLKGGSPTLGYLFLCLVIVCGAFIYFTAFQSIERLKKTEDRFRSLSVDSSDSFDVKEEAASAYESFDCDAVVKKIIGRINVDFSNQEKFSELVLSSLSKEIELASGLFYVNDLESGIFEPTAKYAFYSEKEVESFRVGEGINGQVAKDCRMVVVDNLQENYISIVSGLGKTSPRAIVISPIVRGEDAVALLELAFLNPPSDKEIKLIDSFCRQVAGKITLLQEA